MVRRKGETTESQILQGWRELVEFRPENGAHGPIVNEMYAFARGRDHKQCTLRGFAGTFILLWCFKSPADADAFQARFGGKRVTAPDPMHLKGREWRRWMRETMA
jgi:hypothetical protein